jgi:DNA mismatch endonuclease (patch repair protein)
MDTLTIAQRSRVMARVRSKDTQPERRVRTLVYSLGYRYRLHVRALPGRPDLVFRSRRCVILVHGCFWHQHQCKAGNRRPKSRVEFWNAKLAANMRRDVQQRRELHRMGWRVLTIWECETLVKSHDRIARTIIAFLGKR